jgi:hypothetical protein
MTTHADNHDRDKLSRWRGDLTSGEALSFPVYAVFLVTPEDRPAHDIFRAFRSSFEERGAGFQHLMIFGQHGISTTVKGLLAELGLGVDALPLLGLFPGPPSDAIHTIGLRQGDYGSGESGDAKALNGPWMDVLGFLEQAADGGGEALNLNLEGNLKPLSLGAGAMGQIVERVLGSVS